MQDATLESTLEAKEALKTEALSCGVKVQQYHADNGWYADPVLTKDCKPSKRKIAFCGVGAHH